MKPKFHIIFLLTTISLFLLSHITNCSGDKPGLKINLNPPEENTKDTIGMFYKLKIKLEIKQS